MTFSSRNTNYANEIRHYDNMFKHHIQLLNQGTGLTQQQRNSLLQNLKEYKKIVTAAESHVLQSRDTCDIILATCTAANQNRFSFLLKDENLDRGCKVPQVSCKKAPLRH